MIGGGLGSEERIGGDTKRGGSLGSRRGGETEERIRAEFGGVWGDILGVRESVSFDLVSKLETRQN